jgi:hypothetical protein
MTTQSLKKIAPSGKVTISGRDEALENIQAYYDDDSGSVFLPPHQEEIRFRWETIHGLILKGKSLQQIIKTVSETYDVSPSTVRRDIPCVEAIFSSQTLNFAMRRQRASNLALKTYEKANKEKDLTNMNRAIGNLIKADGLEHEPVELPKIEPHVYVVVLDENTQALLNKAFPMQDGVINLNDITQTLDIEHEELPTDDQRGD